MQIKFPLALLVIASLPACSMQEGDFPSLAKRPFEGAPIADTNRPVPTITDSLPAELQAAVDEAIALSNAAHRKFQKNLPGVTRRVNSARGSTISSESWVVAQMDLAALEMVRTPSVTALADIDALYIERLSSEFERESPGGAAIIAGTRAQISAHVENQQDAIDAMKAKLR